MQVPSDIEDATVHTKTSDSMLYNDHFNVTHLQQSSRVTFRGESIYIYDHGASQLQMRISQKAHQRDSYTSGRSEAEEIDEEIDIDVSNISRNSYYPSLQIDTKDVQHDRGPRWIYTLVALFCMATVSLVTAQCLKRT